MRKTQRCRKLHERESEKREGVGEKRQSLSFLFTHARESASPKERWREGGLSSAHVHVRAQKRDLLERESDVLEREMRKREKELEEEEEEKSPSPLNVCTRMWEREGEMEEEREKEGGRSLLSPYACTRARRRRGSASLPAIEILVRERGERE